MSAEQSSNAGYAAGLDFPYAGALLRVGAMAALHPVDYAKTLIQIGHEPLAPAQTKTLITQKPALALPSVFRWVVLLATHLFVHTSKLPTNVPTRYILRY